MESSILSEVDDTSILRMVLSTCYWPALHSIGLSAHVPAQRAGAQRLRALARLRNFSHLPKSVWSLGYCRLAFLTLSSSHFGPSPLFRGRAEQGCSARVLQTSIFSAISTASSISMPRYRTRAFDFRVAQQ